MEKIPFSYQLINGDTIAVSCSYVERKSGLGFEIDNYNPNYPLVIDPQMIFSTYSGSFSDNFGFTATYDNQGFLYGGGNAYGSNYPTTTGAYDVGYNGGGFDIVITKFDTTGSFLVYSTYLGGSDNEQPHSIIANEFGELYIMGTTGSSNFPTTVGAYDRTFEGGRSTRGRLGAPFTNGIDIVVSKLSADGSNLLASTFLGGQENDGFNGFYTTSGGAGTSPRTYYNFADEFRGEIDIDPSGNVYIASTTYSTDFPITPNAFQSNFNPGAISNTTEGIITIFNPGLSILRYSTYMGGTGFEAIHSIAIRENDVLFAGGTSSTSLAFPSNKFGFQNNFGGATDGIFGSFNPTTGELNFISYTGGTAYDQSFFIEFDKEDYIYLFGQTEETGNYFTSGNPGYNDASGGLFVSKFSADGKTRLLSTTVGVGAGMPRISPTAFLVDNCQRIYIAGWATNINNPNLNVRFLPVTSDAFDGVSEDAHDQYLAVFAPDMANLVYGTYIGDPATGEHVDGGTSRFDKKGVVYQAVCAGCGASSGFPTSPNDAWSHTNNSPNCNMAVFKFDLEPPSIAADFAIPNPGCQPSSTFTFTNLSSPAQEYKWSFGDGSTSGDINPTHTYAEPGVYTVQLIAIKPDACNITDTIEKTFPFVFEGVFPIRDTALCPGESVNIGPDIPNGLTINSLQWEAHPDIANPNQLDPTVTPSAPAVYRLNINLSGCDLVYEYSVDVEQFSPDLATDTILCNDQNPIRLTTASQGVIDRFYWSRNRDFSPLISFNPPGDSIVNFAVDNRDTFYIRYESDVCIYYDSIVVERLQSLLPEDTVYCEGQGFITLSLPFNNRVNSYAWSANSNFSPLLNDNAGDRDITIQPTDTTYYYYSMQSDDCVLIDSILVSPFVIADFPDSTICKGDFIDLGFLIPQNLNVNFKWKAHPDIPDVDDPNPRVSPATSTMYTLVLTANENCVIEKTFNLTVQDLTYDLTPDTLLCDKQIALLLEVATLFDVEIFWSDAADFSNKINTGNNSSISVLPAAGVYTYYVRLRSIACETIDSVKVFVHSPAPSNQVILCDTSSSYELTSDGLGKITKFEWSEDRNFSNLLNDDDRDSSILVSPRTNTYYYIRTSTPFCSYFDSVLVRPFFSIVTPDTLVCDPANSITLVANGSLPNTKVFWSDDAQFGNILNGPAEPSITVLPQTDSKTYYVRLEASGCTIIDSTRVLIHKPVENPLIIKCDPRDSTELISDGLGFITSYEWSTTKSFGDLLNDDITDSTAKVLPQLLTKYYIRTKTDFCTYMDSVEVDPFFIQVSPDTLVCDDNTPIVFSASSSFSNTTIVWSDQQDFSNVLNPGGQSSINVNSGDETDVYYVSLSARGCNRLDSSRVLIHDPIDADEIFICDPNDSLNLVSDGYGKIDSFLWSSNRNFTDTLNDGPLDSAIIVSPKLSAWFYIKTRSELCDYEDSVFVKRLLPAPIADTLICDPLNPIILTADGNGVAFSFVWDTLADFSSNPPLTLAPNDSSITVLPDFSTRYFIKISTTTCSHIDSVDVLRINPEFGLDTLVYCYPFGTEVKANSDGIANNFTWSTNKDFDPVLSSDSTLTVNADSLQTYYIKFGTDFCDIIDSISLRPFIIEPFEDSVICTGSTITLGYQDIPFANGVYQWLPNGDIADINELNPVVTPSEGINQYTLTVNIPGLNCPLEVVQTVIVSSLLDSISPSQVVCDTSLNTLLQSFSLDTINTEYEWSTSNDFSNPLNHPDTSFISVKYTADQWYYVRLSNGICTANDSLFLRAVFPFPFKDTLVCNPEDSIKISLDHKNAFSDYLWSTNSNFSDTVKYSSTDSTMSFLPDSSTTYYFKASTLTCEFVDSIVINRYHTHLISDSLICDPSTPIDLRVIKAGASSVVQWDTLADFSSVPPLPTTELDSAISVLPDKNTTYYVKVGTATCTYVDSTTLYRINSGLAEDTIIICNPGNTATLIANSDGFAKDFFWSLNRNFNPIIEGDSIIIIRPDTLTTYYLRMRTPGCLYDDSVTVSPFEIPYLKPIEICNGQTATLGPDNPNSFLFSTYQWQANKYMTPTDLSLSQPIVSPDSSFLFTLTYKQKNCSRTLKQQVTVEDIGKLFVQADPLAICDPSKPVVLTADGKGKIASYRWSEFSNYSVLLNGNPTDSSISYNFTGGSRIIYLEGTTEHGCSFEENITLQEVNAVPNILGENTFCLGDTIRLIKDPNAFVTVDPIETFWNPIDIMTKLPAKGDTVLVVPTDTVTVTATFVYNSGCTKTRSIFLNPSLVYSYEPDIEIVDSTVYLGQEFTLRNANPNLLFTTEWVPKGLDGDPFKDSQRYLADRQLGYVILQSSDAICAKNDTIFLSDEYNNILCGPPDIFIPNAFSPNEDGENDLLRVRGKFIEEMLFRVYDRWGQLVFESRDKDLGWDGVFNGVKLNPAVYVYYLEATCINRNKYFTQGNVTLIR